MLLGWLADDADQRATNAERVIADIGPVLSIRQPAGVIARLDGSVDSGGRLATYIAIKIANSPFRFCSGVRCRAFWFLVMLNCWSGVGIVSGRRSTPVVNWLFGGDVIPLAALRRAVGPTWRSVASVLPTTNSCGQTHATDPRQARKPDLQ